MAELAFINEPDGFYIEYLDTVFGAGGSMVVKDLVTPANNYSGLPFSKLTYSRTGATTYWNSAGVLTAALANAPRIDYDPVTLAIKGVLVEESRINLALQSNTFSTTWTLTNATITQNATGVDNTTSAWTFTDNTNPTALHRLNQTIAIATLPSGTTTTFSVIIKAGTASFVQLLLTDGSTAQNYVTAIFNLSTGTANTQTAVGSSSGTLSSGTATNSGIQSLGNGRYRIWITAAITAVATHTFTLSIAPAATGNTFGTTGNITYTGTNQTLIVERAQIEAGAFPTSYIPTTTTAVTRGNETITLATSLFNYSATAGSAYTKFQHFGNYSTDAMLSFDDGTSAERVLIRYNDSVSPQVLVTDGSVQQANLDLGTPTQALAKIAAAWAVNDVNGAFNGVICPTPATTATLPTPTTFRLGNHTNAAASFFNGWFQEVAYYPRRLSPAELTALTT